MLQIQLGRIETLYKATIQTTADTCTLQWQVEEGLSGRITKNGRRLQTGMAEAGHTNLCQLFAQELSMLEGR